MNGLHDDVAQQIQEQLLELRREFVEGLPPRLKEIGDLWGDYAPDGDRKSGKELLSAIHKIAGTATIFGVTDLGQLARNLQIALEDIFDDIEVETNEKFIAENIDRLISYDVRT
ncbi:Hpt domain-containing protein [Breoghania sp.]|uniref:Hpt domain-containing protein n=1 Tax=Breoghania sp. TaxID=2065378 RepID=UPI0026294C4E|nr:Hpt domain-containing protein [Breoghania sp.]MDJ0933327.1 Hpt domain-containing protein [Breoghania sp.]